MTNAKATRPKTTLTVDGKAVELNHFVELALTGIVEGFLGALRDIPSGEVIVRIPAERREP